MQVPSFVAIAWGSVIVLQSDGSLLSLKEKSLSSKLDLLCNKSLYTVALSTAQSEQVSLFVRCIFCHAAKFLLKKSIQIMQRVTAGVFAASIICNASCFIDSVKMSCSTCISYGTLQKNAIWLSSALPKPAGICDSSLSPAGLQGSLWRYLDL